MPETGQGLTSMVRVSVAVLPAASVAVIVMMLSSPQWRGMPEIVQGVVPEAVPSPPRSFTPVNAHLQIRNVFLSANTKSMIDF
jgi:hypothetical protein